MEKRRIFILTLLALTLLVILGVQAEVVSPACTYGEFLYGSSGFFSSPKFPNYFPQYNRCTWNITVPSGYIIKVSFHHFDLGSWSSKARVAITNVTPDNRWNQPFQLYGRYLPSPVYSVGNSIQVIFTSLTRQYSGFNASYTAITYESVCPNLKTLNETSGVITSPFFPRIYPENQRCSWQITASKGKRIVLDIEYMSIEYCGACLCDYLEIEHGLSSDGISIGRKCGHRRVAYYSFGEILKVVFVSNSNSNRYSGFRATYTQVNFTGVVRACTSEELVTGSSGFISSPNFPNNFPQYSSCIWNITVPSGYIINVSFHHVDLGWNGDRVTITNVASYREPFQLYGSSPPDPVYSVGNSIRVIFTSLTDQYSGFSASYTAITYESVCPNLRTLNKTSGVITSPFYPTSYSENLSCSWQIKASKGKRIVFDIEYMRIEYCGSCLCDYLEIEHGLSSDGISTGRKCGYNPVVYYSFGEILTVLFVSNGENNNWLQGFRATYTKVSYTGVILACSSEEFVTGMSGFFSSPNFPNYFPQYSRCIWNITVPSGHIIKLTFHHFELGWGSRAYVTIKQTSDNRWNQPLQLYGRYLPSPVYSVGNSIQVIFTSLTSQLSGFNASYTAITYESVCPNLKTLNETSGVITSPFHPRKYPANQRCSWQITASKGKRIVLDIEYMSIEYCGACSCDYLEIEHGLSSDGISIGRKCGHGRVAYYSFGEILKVVFVSNSNSNRYSGFRATYTQVNFTGVVPACTSEELITGTSGYISSPNFPNRYSQYSRCIWNITVPIVYIIKVSFHHVDLGWNGDRVTFTNIASFREPFQMYGRFLPSPVYSVGNSIQVIFTSLTDQYSGFNASYTAITYESVCPNLMTLNETSGVITSPFYPRYYPDNQACSWQIIASKGKRIVLDIEYVHIDYCEACSCDYLEIQHGLSSDGVSSGRKCGYNYPLVYYSFGQILKVMFVSNGNNSYQHNGFRATYTQVNHTGVIPACTAGEFVTGTSGFFSSPNFPNYFPQYIRCIWNITVPSAHIIKLTFHHFDLGTRSGAYVNITKVASDNGWNQPLQLYGRYLPSPVYSVVDSIQVIFRSLTNQYSGFNASYAAIKLESGPNAPPSNVQGHSTSSTNIFVQWSNVPAADQNGVILSYTVTYKALPDGSPQTEVVSAPTTHVTLTGLNEYTNYSITVFASTVRGDGNVSEAVIVITDEDKPNAPPFNVQGQSTSSTSIFVQWSNVPAADQNGVILSYTVTYKALPDGSPQTKVVSAPTTQVTLTSLNEYTNYSITVFASTIKGYGRISALIIVVTEQDRPSASPLNLQSIDTTFNSILVTWNEVPAADRNGIIVSYTVRYQAIGGDNVNLPINRKTVDFSTKWANLAGLKKETFYRISVLASTVKGDGKYSEPIFVRTNRQESPVTFLQLSEDNIGETEVVVQFVNKQTLKNGNQVRYFQMIVTPLGKGNDPGNPADIKYQTIRRKYEDQVEGEPYITAEFKKDDSRTTFTVGDGKFYSRSAISDDKRKRRDVSSFASYLNGKLKANTRYAVFQRSFDEDGYYKNEGFFQFTTKAKFPTAVIVSVVVALVVLLILAGAFIIWRRCYHKGTKTRNPQDCTPGVVMEMAANNNLAVESSYSNVFELSGDRELGGSGRNTGQRPTAGGQATYDTVADVQPDQVAPFSGVNRTEEEIYQAINEEPHYQPLNFSRQVDYVGIRRPKRQTEGHS